MQTKVTKRNQKKKTKKQKDDEAFSKLANTIEQ